MNVLSIFCSFSPLESLSLWLFFVIFDHVIVLHWTAMLAIVVWLWVIVVYWWVLWIRIRYSSAWFRVVRAVFIFVMFAIREWYFSFRVALSHRAVPWVLNWFPRDIFFFWLCLLRVFNSLLPVWWVVGWLNWFYRWFFSFFPWVVSTSSLTTQMTVSLGEWDLRFLRWWWVVADAHVYRINDWIWVISICLYTIYSSIPFPLSPYSIVECVDPSAECVIIFPPSVLIAH